MRYWNNLTTGTSIVMKFGEVAHEVAAKPRLEEYCGRTPTSLHSLTKMWRLQEPCRHREVEYWNIIVRVSVVLNRTVLESV